MWILSWLCPPTSEHKRHRLPALGWILLLFVAFVFSLAPAEQVVQLPGKQEAGSLAPAEGPGQKIVQCGWVGMPHASRNHIKFHSDTQPQGRREECQLIKREKKESRKQMERQGQGRAACGPRVPRGIRGWTWGMAALSGVLLSLLSFLTLPKPTTTKPRIWMLLIVKLSQAR